MEPIILFIVMMSVGMFGVDWLNWGAPFWQRPTFQRILKFRPRTPEALQPHVRRIQKMEKDGRQALEAIKNLHETKKRLNKDFEDDWNKQFRLLLPPPPTPDRKAVHFRYPGDRHGAFRSPTTNPYNTSDASALVDGYHSPVPVGAIEGPGGYWWYGFNNLPGHSNELLFIRADKFHSADSTAFWAFLPTIRKVNGEYTWSDSKTKALATNIRDTIRG